MKRRVQRKLVKRESRTLSSLAGMNGVGELRTLSDLGGRAMLAALAGKAFHGKRDLFEALGFDRELTVEKFRARYKRNGIAKRIVESGPKATWRGGAELIEDEDPDVSTDFEETFVKLDERLHVWATLCRLDILAGIGRYAVLLVGAPGDVTSEMPKTLSAEDVLYLQPYGEDDAVIKTWDEDPASPRFGQPTSYALTRTNGNVRSTVLNAHWTRCIHVASDVLDENVYGQPRLECVWNDLDNLEKVVGAGSEAFWQRVNRGLALKLDPEADFSAETDTGKARQKALKKELDDYEHKLKRIIALQGVEIQELGGDVSNFAGQLDGILTILAGSTGIPKRILLGSERGELASTQDATNWDTQIEDRRDQFAKPYVLSPFVTLMIDLGVLPEPEQWEVRWPSLVQLDEQGKADLAKKYKDLGQTIATDAEIRDKVLGWPALTEEQKAEIAAAQPVPPTPATAEEEVGVIKGGKNAGQKPPAEMTAAEKQAEEERQQEERAAGGAGSGNFGHGGRPGEVGGSGEGEFFHATSADQVQSIMKQGLTTNHTGKMFRDSQGGVVYVSKTVGGARYWAREIQYGQKKGSDVVILKVQIPREALKKIARDENSSSRLDHTFEGKIKSEWIKGAIKMPWSEKGNQQWMNSTPRAPVYRRGSANVEDVNTDDAIFWVPVVIDEEEPRAAASRKPSLAQLRIDSVAKKREASLTGRLLSAFRRARRALSAKLLTHAASTGAQTMVEFEVGKAFGELERKTLPEVARELRKTVVAGGEAAARSIHLHGVPLGTSRAAGGPGSGNFGHEGRPGEVGGSAPAGEGEGATPLQKSGNDPDFERFKSLPEGTVVASSKRGQVVTFHSGKFGASPRLEYQARTKSGKLIGTAKSVSEGKRKVQEHGAQNATSGWSGTALEWKDR